MLSRQYEPNPKYSTAVAYFSMEFAIHQALKIYSGGLGFLTGSHVRSAYDLRQNIIGVGILWSYGYYDQFRNKELMMSVSHRRKIYYFLKELDVKICIKIFDKDVYVKAFLLESKTFDTAPVILLSTDIEENDFLARTITHKLYDANEQIRVSQEIVLGIGGFKMLEALRQDINIYHLNEGHAAPLIFSLYNKYGNRQAVQQKIVFTTHTPENEGNEEYNVMLLHKMGFFDGLSIENVQEITGIHNGTLNLTFLALRFSKKANAVSEIHRKIANEIWESDTEAAKIITINNAQNRRFWADKSLVSALDEHEDYLIVSNKKHLKRLLFDIVADQTGKMFDPDVLTIVWAKRFVEYKRPGLIKYDIERFIKLIEHSKYPIQMIWAGKPHPTDSNAINMFNEIIDFSKHHKRVAVLIQHELHLSQALKQGADVWLNTPRSGREISECSGMSACMNGAINFSIYDGWMLDFAEKGKNAFVFPPPPLNMSVEEQDRIDNQQLMDMLEDQIIRMYYERPDEWVNMMKTSMTNIMPLFDSGRMVHEYYTLLYDG